MATTHEVLSKLSVEDLKVIANYRGVNTITVEKIEEDITSQGMKLLLEQLSLKLIEKMVSEYEIILTEKKSVSYCQKVLTKRLFNVMKQDGVDNWMRSHSMFAPRMLEDLKLKKVKDKKKAVEGILKHADALGLEMCLSAFDGDRLKEFVQHCDLIVYGTSQEAMLTALMSQKSMKEPTRANFSSISKVQFVKRFTESFQEKPEIEKGISRADLYYWFTLSELTKWCEDNGAPKTGTKKELIKRIRNHLDKKWKADNQEAK